MNFKNLITTALGCAALTICCAPWALADNAEITEEQKLKTDEALQGPFFLVDETPSNTIKILEELTGQIAIQAPNLPNVKINFSTAGKLPRADAIIAFKSLLATNGIVITPLGEKFFKATPMAGSGAQAPTLIVGDAKNLPPSQQLHTKLYELKYIELDSLKENLNKIISADAAASLALFPQKNSFVLTDTLVNQQRVELLLKKIDLPAEIREDIGVVMLKNMGADDLKRRFLTIKSEILKKYFERTTIEADERTNQVFIATTKGNLKNILDIVQKLDVDAQPLTRSEVFYIKHGESKDIETVLNSIVKGQKAAAKNAQNSKNAAANAQNRQNRISNAQNRAQGGGQLPTNLTADPTGAALQFSDYITIVSDERSNAIVAYGTPTDLKQISDIVSKIDILMPQVKIDVIITEVTLTDNQTSGLESFGLSYSTLLDSTTNKKGWTGNTSMSPMQDSNTIPFKLSIDEYGFSSVFGIASQNNNVKILSAPSIVTTHNNEATVNVSETQPLLSETTTYDTSAYPQTRSTISWKDIGIILKVTPLIGENGAVQMKIKQTVESVVNSQLINNVKQPIIGKREAESFVSSKSGETIVMAGLQQTKTNSTDGEVFLLSDIPLIGNLFKPATDKNTRTELIIFIRPTVVHSDVYSKVLANEGMHKSRIGKEVESYFKTGKFHDDDHDFMGRENRKRSSLERTLLHPDDPMGEKAAQAETEKAKNSANAEKKPDAADAKQASAQPATQEAEHPSAAKRITGHRK